MLLPVSLPAPAFTISPKASPSTALTPPRTKEGAPSSDKRSRLITIIIICVGALIGVLLVVLTICFCAFRKGKKKVPLVETRMSHAIHSNFDGFFSKGKRLFSSSSFLKMVMQKLEDVNV